MPTTDVLDSEIETEIRDETQPTIVSDRIRTITQFDIIELLVRNGPMQQVDIAEALNVTQSTISVAKRPLMQSGIVYTVSDDVTDETLLKLDDTVSDTVEVLMDTLSSFETASKATENESITEF